MSDNLHWRRVAVTRENRERSNGHRVCVLWLEECERRDGKGIYRKARSGEVAEFAGISAPYEEPLAPAVTLDSDARSLEACVDDLVESRRVRDMFPSRDAAQIRVAAGACRR